jgi:hypothetical protein
MPPYLADRSDQLARFIKHVEAFPENSSNLRITGLRGVGKTVLLREYERLAIERGWVVIRRDLTPRLQDESDFARVFASHLEEAAEQLSMARKIKNIAGKTVGTARQLATFSYQDIDISLGGDTSTTPTLLDDAVRTGLAELAELAAKADRGVVFLYDEAHVLRDRKRSRQFPLSALLSAFVSVQEQDVPVMLVLCGLPPLVRNLSEARSHSERMFRAEDITRLNTTRRNGVSEAALALIRPAEDTKVLFDLDVAEQVVREIDGYPYFIQKYGAALWDAAVDSGSDHVAQVTYATIRKLVRDDLDFEFFEGRYVDAKRADQKTLRVAASLGDETFVIADLIRELGVSNNVIQASINRLIQDNLVFRVRYGEVAYTAPMFGDYLRRKHPRQQED